MAHQYMPFLLAVGVHHRDLEAAAVQKLPALPCF
jgi:hypothetical protein